MEKLAPSSPYVLAGIAVVAVLASGCSSPHHARPSDAAADSSADPIDDSAAVDTVGAVDTVSHDVIELPVRDGNPDYVEPVFCERSFDCPARLPICHVPVRAVCAPCTTDQQCVEEYGTMSNGVCLDGLCPLAARDADTREFGP